MTPDADADERRWQTGGKNPGVRSSAVLLQPPPAADDGAASLPPANRPPRPAASAIQLGNISNDTTSILESRNMQPCNSMSSSSSNPSAEGNSGNTRTAAITTLCTAGDDESAPAVTLLCDSSRDNLSLRLRAARAAGCFKATAAALHGCCLGKTQHEPYTWDVKRHGARAKALAVALPWRKKAWAWLVRAWKTGLVQRMVRIAGSALFVLDVVLDALVAKNMFSTDGYRNFGILVVVFMLVHYPFTYVMLLYAANKAFFAQQAVLPIAAAASIKSTTATTLDGQPPSSSSDGASAAVTAPLVVVLTSILKSLHMFFYVLLIVFGIPLIPVMDVYMVIASLMWLPGKTPEEGYMMRIVGDVCRHYERIRLPLECFLESLPQFIIQSIVYSRNFSDNVPPESVRVSKAVLIISITSSTAQLARVMLTLILAKNASGGTFLQYFWALWGLQGFHDVPPEVMSMASRRLEEHLGDGSGDTGPVEQLAEGADPVVQLATTQFTLRGPNSTVGQPLVALPDGNTGMLWSGGAGPRASTARIRTGNTSTTGRLYGRSSQMYGSGSNLTWAQRHSVFRLGGPEDAAYQALSTIQRGVLVDGLFSRADLHRLGALHLQQLEPEVVSRLFQNPCIATLPAYLKLEDSWRPKQGHHGRSISSRLHLAASSSSKGGVPAYLDVVTKWLPEATLVADPRWKLRDLHLAHLELCSCSSTAGGGGTAASREAVLRHSATVGVALAQVLSVQHQLTWLLVDRCDVHVPAMLEALEGWLLAHPVVLGAGDDDEGLESRVLMSGGQQRQQQQCTLVVVHSQQQQDRGEELEQWLMARVGLPAAAVATPDVTPSPTTSQRQQGPGGATTSRALPRVWLRELHIIQDSIPSLGLAAEAQVLVAPHPRVPGLLNALLPLLSTVLAPAVLDLNTAAFSELGLDEAALIGACLVVNSSLETLKLRAIGLRPDSLPLVLRGMVTHSCLRSVDLSFNNIGDNGVKLLADTIPHLPNLNAILLAGCGMGANGANALAGQLLSIGAHSQLVEFSVHDNKPECATPALEWVCFLFKQRTEKSAKPTPFPCLEGFPDIPTFGLDAAAQQACFQAVRSKSLSVPDAGPVVVAGPQPETPAAEKGHSNQQLVMGSGGKLYNQAANRKALLCLPPRAAFDLRYLVMVATTAAVAPSPVALDVSSWLASSGGRGNDEGPPLLSQQQLLPGFQHPGGAATLLVAVAGSLLHATTVHRSITHIHLLDLSFVDFSTPKVSLDSQSLVARATGQQSIMPTGVTATITSGHSSSAPYLLSTLEHLCRGLANNRTLRVLRLVGCQLSSEAAVVLCSELRNGSCPGLQRLELHQNPKLGHCGMQKGVVPLLAAAAAGRHLLQHVTITQGGEPECKHGGEPLTITADADVWQSNPRTIPMLLHSAAAGWADNGGHHSNNQQGSHRFTSRGLVAVAAAAPGGSHAGSGSYTAAAGHRAVTLLAHLQLITGDAVVDTLVRSMCQCIMAAPADVIDDEAPSIPGVAADKTPSVTLLDTPAAAAVDCARGVVAAIKRGSCPAGGSSNMLPSSAFTPDTCCTDVSASGDGTATGSLNSISLQVSRDSQVAAVALTLAQTARHGLAAKEINVRCRDGHVLSSAAAEWLVQALGSCTSVVGACHHVTTGTTVPVGENHRPVLCLGPVQPSASLVRSLARLSGLQPWAGDDDGDAQQQQGAITFGTPAAGRSRKGGGSSCCAWSIQLYSGSTEVDACCKAFLDYCRKQQKQQQGHDAGGNGAPVHSPAAEGSPNCIDNFVKLEPASAHHPTLPISPGVMPMSMRPESTMALTWAICRQQQRQQQHVRQQQIACGAASSKGSLSGPQAHQHQHQPMELRACLPVTALLISAPAGPQEEEVKVEGGCEKEGGNAAISDTAAALLEACKVCHQMQQQLPMVATGGGGGALAGAQVVVQGAHQLTDDDAAVLAVALLPGDIGCVHQLVFRNVELSLTGSSTLLQLLPLHGRTLRHLDVSGCRLVHCWQLLAAALRPCSSLEQLLVGGQKEALALKGTGLLPERATSCLQFRYFREDLSVRDAKTEDEKALLLASHRGDLVAVMRLLKDNGVNPNIMATPRCGVQATYTALHCAINAGHKGVAEALLWAGAEVAVKDDTKDGNLPSHVACIKGRMDLLEMLLRSEVDIEARNTQGLSHLHLASLHGMKDVVGLLLQRGAKLTSLDKNGSTPLHVACSSGHLEVVEMLLRWGADVTIPDWTSNTPFHVAVDKGHVKVVERLLSAPGADVNDKNKESLRNGLHKASHRGYHELVELLIREGGNVNEKDSAQDTPLHGSCSAGHPHVVRMLLDAGAEVEAKNKDGSTPLMLASNGGHQEAARVLLRKGADVHAKGASARTALHKASVRGNLQVAELLLKEGGADVNATDAGRETALHAASRAGHADVVEMLIGRKADIDACNKDGNTALHLAALEGWDPVIRSLVEAGANLNIVNNDGNGVLDITLKPGAEEIRFQNSKAKAKAERIQRQNLADDG